MTSTLTKNVSKKQNRYIDNPGIKTLDTIIPIVINYNGIINRKSAEMLDRLLEEVRPPVLYKAIYREIGKSWASAENLTLRKQMDLLDQEEMPI